jgi:hypothetical protein
MDLIEVREDATEPNGAVLRIDGYDLPVTIASPFDAKQLRELDWCFEEHLRFPFTDQVRARQAGGEHHGLWRGAVSSVGGE